VSEYRLKQKSATRERTGRGALRFGLDALQASRRETRENRTRANMDLAVYIMQPRTIAFSLNRTDRTGSGEYLIICALLPRRLRESRSSRFLRPSDQGKILVNLYAAVIGPRPYSFSTFTSDDDHNFSPALFSSMAAAAAVVVTRNCLNIYDARTRLRETTLRDVFYE